MIKTGTTDFVISRENESNESVDIEVSVDWELEKSEYGDGSEDVDFITTATDDSGKEYILSEKEETRLYEELLNRGEFE